MSFIKFLNISILFFLFTPFIKCCEGESPVFEEAVATEEYAAIEAAQDIDTLGYQDTNETLVNNPNEYLESTNNIDTTIEPNVNDTSDEPNIFIKALIIAAYPEGIFTSVSGFGLIMESFDNLYKLNFKYDWYFGLLILTTIIIHLMDQKKQSTKLNTINTTVIILTWIILIINSRLDSLLWGFYLYSFLIFAKTIMITKNKPNINIMKSYQNEITS